MDPAGFFLLAAAVCCVLAFRLRGLAWPLVAVAATCTLLALLAISTWWAYLLAAWIGATCFVVLYYAVGEP